MAHSLCRIMVVGVSGVVLVFLLVG